MAIPTTSNYPTTLDDDASLFGDPANQITLTLASSIDNDDTTFTVNESIDDIEVPVFFVFETGEIVYCEDSTPATKLFSSVTRGAGAAAHDASERLRLSVVGQYISQLKNAIVAIETELGTDPSGAFASVASAISTHLHTGTYPEKGNIFAGNGGGKTISSGAITVDPDAGESKYVISPESGNDDNLDTISGGVDGDVIFLYPNSSTSTITLTEAGNILIPGGATTKVLGNSYTCLVYSSSYWRLVDTGKQRRVVSIRVTPHDVTPTVGDDKGRFEWPQEFDGWKLLDLEVSVDTYGSGTSTFQLHSLTDGADICSTRPVLDASEYSTRTAATPAVLNSSYTPIAAGDRWRFDFDTIGSGVKGVTYILTIEGDAF